MKDTDLGELTKEAAIQDQAATRQLLANQLAIDSSTDQEFWFAVLSPDFLQPVLSEFLDQEPGLNYQKIISAVCQLTLKNVRDKCQAAFASKSIPAAMKKRQTKWFRAFTTFVTAHTLQPAKDAPPSLLHAMMKNGSLSRDKQKKFMSVYLNHGAIDKQLWAKLEKDKSFSTPEVNRLRFVHALPELDKSNEKLVGLATALPHIHSLRELALEHDSHSLASLLDPAMLPPDIPGSTTKAKLRHYASTLQHKLFHTETSAVLQRMAMDKALPIRNEKITRGIARFFHNQPDDFNIRTTSVYKALKNKNALEGIPQKYHDETIGHLKSLQRIQAISPDPDTMVTLMKANVQSAHQVTEMPEATFVKTFSGKLGETVARQVHANAINIKIRNEQALLSMRELVRGSDIRVIEGGSTIQDRKEAFNKQAADSDLSLDWESLFGSVDFCECGECTSVYSPAAYFVELLQYLRNNDLDPNATGILEVRTDPTDISNTVLEKLFRRRPDLRCLELTCANTNTVMPYVDIVNQIMESFIVRLDDYAKSTLKPKQATIETWNVAGETSAELLAEPQHINNDAYRTLKKAVYPFTLPYDRPVNMIRSFLTYLDTSRHELMKVMRSREQDSVSDDIMPDDIKLPAAPSPDPLAAKIPAINMVVNDRAIDAELLLLTHEEYIILTKEAFVPKTYFDLRKPGTTDGQYRDQIGVKSVPEYYGYPANTGKAEMLSLDETLQSGLTFVKKQFLKRTGLAYTDLVELLKTQSINPVYPAGKALQMLQRVPFSYRFLQSLVNTGSIDPEIRLKKVIDALQNPQQYLPGHEEKVDYNPCGPIVKHKPGYDSAAIEQWVLCYFERVGQVIVLEDGTPPCPCVEGKFLTREGDNIQVGSTEGQLYLSKSCELSLVRKSKTWRQPLAVGTIDAATGVILLRDPNGTVLPPTILSDQGVFFQGSKNEAGLISAGRLLDRSTDRPFGCKQAATDNCDISKIRLRHLDGSELTVKEYDKMHRFIRLWRKMGWQMDELDQALVGLSSDKTLYTRGYKDSCDAEVDPVGFAEITPDIIHQLALVKKLLDQTDLELVKLLSFWTTIGTRGDHSLYQRLFLTHNLLAIDDIFKPDSNGGILLGSAIVGDHLPALMGAFRVKPADITAIAAETDPLDLPTVSKIHRQVILSKQIGVNTSELTNVFSLFGDPFLSADKAFEFWESWKRMEDSGFSFAQLNYLINDIDRVKTPIKPAAGVIISLAQNVYNGLTGIDEAHPDLSKTDAATINVLAKLNAGDKKTFLQNIATEALLHTKLGVLFDEAKSSAISGIMQGTTTYAAVALPALVKSNEEFVKKFPSANTAQKAATKELIRKLQYDAQSGSVRITGILTTKELHTARDIFKKAAWHAAIDNLAAQPDILFDELLTPVFSKNITSAKKILLAPDLNNTEDPSSDTAPAKRLFFLERFLPFLRDQLSEKLITETLAGASGLDNDTCRLLISNVLKGKGGQFLMDLLKDVRQKPAAPNMNSWKGYLIPANEESYIFSINTKTKTFSLLLDGETIIDQSVKPVHAVYSSTAKRLKAGQLYSFEVNNLPADFSAITWNSMATARTLLPAAVLLPADQIIVVSDSFLKLFKTAIVVNTAQLSAAEIDWLQQHPTDFGSTTNPFDFNQIDFERLERVNGFTRLRNMLPGSDLSLLAFFKWAKSGASTPSLTDQLALLLNRKKEEMDSLIAPTHFDLVQPADFANDINLTKLIGALGLYDRLNMKLDLLFDWAKPVCRFDACQAIAETIRKSIQARYAQQDWEIVVKPLSDQLRENQKQAMINFLLVQPELIEWGVVDADSLFEFFLADVQMDTCMETSPLKQAISSVQLFIYRYFLGSEVGSGVPSDVLDRPRWNFLSRHQLYVPYKQVTLWPENWTDTNLRDDKSTIFKQMESDFLQKDINPKIAREALMSYASQLNEIANPEVVGLTVEMVVDNKGVETNDVAKLHVFARTRNASYSFYYRYYDVLEGNWYPWEKIQADIPCYDTGREKIHLEIENGIFNDADPSRLQCDVVVPNFPHPITGTAYPVKLSKPKEINFQDLQNKADNGQPVRINNVSIPLPVLNGTVFGDLIVRSLTKPKYVDGYIDGELVRTTGTNGSFLIPVFWNNRLLLFFPQIKKATRSMAVDENGTQAPIDCYEIKMSWIEYKDGKWGQKQTGTDPLYSLPMGGVVQIEFFQFVPVIDNTKVVIQFGGMLDYNNSYSGGFVFDGYQLSLAAATAFTDPMLMNYFNRVQQYQPNQTGQVASWQYSKGKRTNTTMYIESSGLTDTVHGAGPTAPFYHPFIHELMGKLNSENPKSFFQYNQSIANKADAFGADLKSVYHELKRPYSLYNWELFFHVPMAIAKELQHAGQFEEALKWYHFVFDPTAPGADPKRFWKFQPFKEIDATISLNALFSSLQPNTPNTEINEWRKHPFMPHLIARGRPSAYMKWVVMQYAGCLVECGDHFYRQNTIESINYATFNYVMASHICHPKMETIPPKGKKKPETYFSLLSKWDAAGNAMVELELIAPFSNQIATPFAAGPGAAEVSTANIFGFASSLYFCIPDNPKMTELRNRIADRLYKIRHCQNIEGVVQKLPLWDPPLDPLSLITATLNGQTLDSLLSERNMAVPNYRFVYLLQKAAEASSEVRSLNNFQQSISEKVDSEKLDQMRAMHETTMQTLIMESKKLQLDEANATLEGLLQNRVNTAYRLKHYLQLLGEGLDKIPAEGAAYSEIADGQAMVFVEGGLRLIQDEHEEMDQAHQAILWQHAAGLGDVASSLLHIVPDDIYPTPAGHVKFGGTNLGHAASAIARGLQMISAEHAYQSSSAGRKAGFRRQLQDRVLQANQAGYECMQLDKQIASQRLRITLAEKEITNQQKSIDNTTEILEFLKSKYTNQELYQWLEGNLKAVNYQAFSIACDLFIRARKLYCFERGLPETGSSPYAYWDPSRNGLLAGERLLLDIKKLETAYQENRGHDFEITKHISLQQINPLALIKLRATQKCEFALDEVLFDMDFPGHYKRRIKSVSLTIPCIAGPYAGINATLRLTKHAYRVNPVASGAMDYARKMDEPDDRFATAVIPISAIATSSGQRDSGVFELDFRGERYLPFEGGGCISSWYLEINNVDVEKITDVVMTIYHLANDGGDKLKKPATEHLQKYLNNITELSAEEGLFAMFDIKTDFANEWYKAFEHSPAAEGRQIELGNLGDRLPFFTRHSNIKAITSSDVMFVVETEDKIFKISDLGILINKTPVTTNMDGVQKISNEMGMYRGSAAIDLKKSGWSLKIADKMITPKRIILIIRYGMTSKQVV